MSTTKIVLNVDLDALPGDIESVVLSDPTESFGVIRKDTNGVVVPAGTIMARVAKGQYEYEFTDPAPGLEYRYYVKSVAGNDTYFYERDYSKSDGVIVATGRYSSYECMCNKFGQDNILTWATFSDADDEAILTERIQAAIDYADDFVDDQIRGGPYILPFIDSIPTEIVDIACTFAGVHLYTARGVEDFGDEGGTRLTTLITEAVARLGKIRSGRMQLLDMTGSNHLQPYAEEMPTYKIDNAWPQDPELRIVRIP